MQIERDTYGMLQCHPYPNEYVDPSKQCAHCAFFMGLQRKQGVRIQEGQQFDIRGTVDEFRHSVNMYMFWKPGMEIYVSHVRRKQIPSYVFPEGYKRPRPSRPTSHQQVDRTHGADVTEEPESVPVEQQYKGKDGVLTDTKPDKPEKPDTISPNQELHEASRVQMIMAEVEGGSVKLLGIKRTNSADSVDRELDRPKKRTSISPHHERSGSPEVGQGGLPEASSGISECAHCKLENGDSHVGNDGASIGTIFSISGRMVEDVNLPELVGSESIGLDGSREITPQRKQDGGTMDSKSPNSGGKTDVVKDELEVYYLVFPFLLKPCICIFLSKSVLLFILVLFSPFVKPDIALGGVVLKAQGGADSDATQKSAMRHVFLYLNTCVS